MSRLAVRARWPLAVCIAFACAWPGQGARPPYAHNRMDYERFRDAHPDLLEPNYLPFMAWTVQTSGGEVLVFCHWPEESFPLDVYVGEPEIGDALQDEFYPTTPQAFVEAVKRALAAWQEELGGLVAFRDAPAPEDATLVVRLIGEEAPVPDPGMKVLGTTPLGDACVVQEASRWGRLRGWLGLGAEAPQLGRVPVRYRVPELRVYVADEFGLLNPDQVERVALHEIGHALGMRSHSPIPNDLMFQTVLERPGPARLSFEDVNSFVSLYGLPNGTIYRRLSGREGRAARPGPPSGPPELELAPHVDARRGFEIQLPLGWLKLDTPTGVVAVDGTTWDYAASLQLIVRRFATIDDYLARHAAAHVRDGTVLSQGETRVAGRPAFLLVVQSADGSLVDRTTLIEAGDGRVFVAIADCAPEDCAAYEPWFEASLATLEIRGGRREGGRNREYRHEP